MSKDELVMVVRNQDLFSGGENRNSYFQGHSLPQEYNFLETILKKRSFVLKSLADNHKDYTFYKQPIAYGIIFNPFTNYIYLFQRAKNNKDYSERRLQGNISIGVGGHTLQQDLVGDIFYNALLREIREEVEIHGSFKIKKDFLAYINIDQIIGSENDKIKKMLEDVSKRHFGLLYLIVTNANKVVPKKEHCQGEMFPLQRLDEKFDELQSNNYVIEPWTKISRGVIKKFIL